MRPDKTGSPPERDWSRYLYGVLAGLAVLAVILVFGALLFWAAVQDASRESDCKEYENVTVCGPHRVVEEK